MTRAHLLVFLGLLVALAPFSGLPIAWLEWALPVLGVAVAAVGLSYRPRSNAAGATDERPS